MTDPPCYYCCGCERSMCLHRAVPPCPKCNVGPRCEKHPELPADRCFPCTEAGIESLNRLASCLKR